MTIRTGTEILFNPTSDFVRIDRGTEWGIKITHTDEFRFIAVFSRPVGGSTWQAHVVSNMDWQEEVVDMSVKAWFVSKVLPTLQKWLTDTFPKLGDVTDPKLKLSLELDSMIVRELRVVANPDRTLTAFFN